MLEATLTAPLAESSTDTSLEVKDAHFIPQEFRACFISKLKTRITTSKLVLPVFGSTKFGHFQETPHYPEQLQPLSHLQ